MVAVPNKRHFTQWAVQFAVASELCKRAYEVSFTLGHNTPLADLMVISPKSHKMFLIDVKGLAGKNYWQIARKERRDEGGCECRYICRVRSIEAGEAGARGESEPAWSAMGRCKTAH
jgi:hypothetical protein